jgi:hypothetical protein
MSAACAWLVVIFWRPDEFSLLGGPDEILFGAIAKVACH